MNNSDVRKSLIKQIHILKHNLALDEDLYRTALESITGKRSAALCSEAELRKAVMILRFRRRQDNRGSGFADERHHSRSDCRRKPVPQGLR